MTGLYIVAAALLVALTVGGYRRLTDGRARAVRPTGAVLDAGDLGADLGSHATFVQFSSSTCAPCRATHRLLTQFTADTATLAHVEIDAGHRLDLVDQFGITRTPTVLLLDHTGAVRQRIVGAPRKPDVVDALQKLANPAA